jgi:hypothetical protein
MDCSISVASTDIGSDLTDELDLMLSRQLNGDLDRIDSQRVQEEPPPAGHGEESTQPPCEGELRALANYKKAHGMGIEPAKLKADGLLGKYALVGVDTSGNGAYIKKLKREINEDHLASAVFPHLTDEENISSP